MRSASAPFSRFNQLEASAIPVAVAVAAGWLMLIPTIGFGQAITISNPGFETPSMGTGAGAYAYARNGGLTIAAQGGAGWSFSTYGTGFAANGSAFNVTGASGNQAAFMQNEPGQAPPRMWQDISGFQRGAGYQLTFLGEYRPYGGAGNPLSVRVGDQLLRIEGDLVFIPPTGTSFTQMTSNPFTAAPGAVTLSFEGPISGSQDLTSFIDDVAISQWVQPGTYWAPATGAGGSGTWNLANSFWSSAPDGLAAKAAWTQYSQANVAHFGGTAGTVIVSGPVTANQISFDTTGYSLTDGGGGVVLNGYAPLVSLGSGVSATIGTVLAGDDDVEFAGAGPTSTAILSAANTYSGETLVTNARLLVNGSLASPNVSLAATGSLGGSGRINGQIGGAGSVSPGNSPGILTADSVDPAGGLDFIFEFNAATPDYANAAASVNDVLRLTDSIPFVAALDDTNLKTLFLNFTKAELTLGSGTVSTLEGGFFTDLAADFTALLDNEPWDNAGFQVYVLGDGSGSDTSFNGQGYYNWRNPAMFGWDQSLFLSTVPRTADFGSGDINGQVMLLTIAVPEPSAPGLIGIGVSLACGAAARRARRR